MNCLFENSYIRSITYDDLELIYSWRNKTVIRKFMFNDKPIEWDSHLEWFASLKDDGKNEVKLFLEDDKPRGLLQINNINLFHGTAEWGFYIGDSYRKGLGTLLAYHSLNYIFNDMKIRKLNAQVLGINKRSLRFHEKVGFIKEGILSEQIIRNDEKVNVHLFSQFNKNWVENKRRLMEDYIYDQ